jgi:hypothetical protein
MTRVATTILAAALLGSCTGVYRIEVVENGEQGAALLFHGLPAPNWLPTEYAYAKGKEIADRYCRQFNRSAKLPPIPTNPSERWLYNPVNFDCIE